jgi:hypothetical protein
MAPRRRIPGLRCGQTAPLADQQTPRSPRTCYHWIRLTQSDDISVGQSTDQSSARGDPTGPADGSDYAPNGKAAIFSYPHIPSLAALGIVYVLRGGEL